MYHLAMNVRDYECDMQGIVNNATYLNYFEHARHQFLISKGLDFAAITQQGIYAVIYRCEVDYKRSLVSGDLFEVTVACEAISDHRCCFKQTILKEEKLYTQAQIYVTAIDERRRPVNVQEIFIKLFD